MQNSVITSEEAWKLFRYIGKRIYRRAEIAGIDRAIAEGIIVASYVPFGTRKVRRLLPGPLTIGRSDSEILRLIQRASSRVGREGEHGKDGSSFSKSIELNAERVVGEVPSAPLLLKLVRTAAWPGRTTDFVIAALLAQALHRSSVSVNDVLSILARPAPIITIVGQVKGFEEAFTRLLRDGTILAGNVAYISGHHIHPSGLDAQLSGARHPRWKVVLFAGNDVEDAADDKADERFLRAASFELPILGLAEGDDRIPPLLRRSADLVLTCGPIDAEAIRLVMGGVINGISKGSFSNELASVLTVSDLAAAIRPGMEPSSSYALLADLARRRRVGKVDGDNAGPKHAQASDNITCNEAIEPVSALNSDGEAPTIET